MLEHLLRSIVLVLMSTAFLAPLAATQTTISFPSSDGRVVFADAYGHGKCAVVLAHGGRFNKESWALQARALAAAGFEVLAIDFRGYGQSRGPGDKDPLAAPLYLDVLAAIRYLRMSGADRVSLVGGSMGGAAAGDACIAAPAGQVDRLVMLGAAPNESADKLKCPSLFMVARNDVSEDGPRLPSIRAQYQKAPLRRN